MKHYYKIFFMLLISTTSFSQNLIPNGDFELGPDSSSAGWYTLIDSSCSSTFTILGPDFWTVVNGSPDRLIENKIPCNWNNDTAQSGKAYVDFGNDEAGKIILLSSLKKDSSYHLSCYLSLQTFRGLSTESMHLEFRFNNGGNTIAALYVNNTQWKYYDTTFVATANSTEMEIWGIDPVVSAANCDNVSLIKITNTSISNLFYFKNKIKIYPNPSTGPFQIECENDAEFKIYNLWGDELNYINSKTINKSNHFDLSGFAKGVYFIQIKTEREIIIEKILITN